MLTSNSETKVITKDGKIFGFINIVDLGAILIMILIIVMIGQEFVLNKDQKVSSGKVQTTITIRCPMAREKWVEAIKNGDRIMGTSTYTTAVINSIKVEDAYYTATTSSGKLLWVKHPVLKDIYVDVIIFTDPEEPSLKIGNQEYKVGAEVRIKTKNAALPGIVESITYQ